MRGQPFENELRRRIADLLMSPDAGRAVAGHLRDQTDEWARRAAIVDRGGGPSEARQETAETGSGIARDAAPEGGRHGARWAEHAL